MGVIEASDDVQSAIQTKAGLHLEWCGRAMDYLASIPPVSTMRHSYMHLLTGLALAGGVALGASCAGKGGSGTCGKGVICGAVDGGYDGGNAFVFTTLPTRGLGPGLPFAVAYADDGRIGVAYYWTAGGSIYEVDYLEIAANGSTRTAYIASGTRTEGVGTAFDSKGEANVSYLGQDPNVSVMAADAGGVFWAEANLAIATVHSFVDGGVTYFYPAHVSADVTGPTDPKVVTEGTVVGLFSSMVNTDAGLVVPYRDVHFGQNPTDFNKSNWDAAVGGGMTWTDERIEAGSDTGLDPHAGIGALAKAAVGPLGVGVVSSGEAILDATPTDLIFAFRTPGAPPATLGSWTGQTVVEKVNNSGPAGPSLAADPMMGWGIAWVEMSPSNTSIGSAILQYTTSMTGAQNSWSNAEDVYGSGAGGWEPSLAFDSLDQANIAYYVCSQTVGTASGSCPRPSRIGPAIVMTTPAL